MTSFLLRPLAPLVAQPQKLLLLMLLMLQKKKTVLLPPLPPPLPWLALILLPRR